MKHNKFMEIVDNILLTAIVRKASLLRVVHNPVENRLQIWEKIGNEPLQVQDTMNGLLTASIITRLKIIGGLSITDHHSVQQGIYEFNFGTAFSVGSKKIGIICIPTISNGGCGEEIVVILDSPQK